MIYEIRRGTEIVWSGKAEGKQSRVIMQADMVEVTIKSPVAIAFQKGDTIQVYGETYKLNRPENIAKQNTQIGYTYTVEFEALYYDLGKWILYTLDGSNKLTQPDVYLQGEARTILGLLVQNANRASSGWSLGIVDDTDVIQWTYSSAKLLTVLQDIADQTNLEFWVDGKTINLTRRQNDTGLSLAYGKGKGLYELNRARREDPIVTHLTVAGGSQNIPNSYGYRNIQPTGGNPMVNPAYQDGQDRVESVIVFENIYPRLNAKVTTTSAINIIRSTDLNFDLNDHLLDDGTSAQIAFTSGLLNGFTFTIAKDGYTHANKQILFNAITDDNAYPQGIPNEQLKPSVGDTFVLLNFNMPKSYVDHAEARVKELGDQYFAEEGIEQYDWTGKLTPKFVLENEVELTLGGLVELQAEDIGFNGSIRVDSYTRDLQQEYLYDFTLSNVITINKLVRERNMSDRLANTVSKGISQDGLSTKATFAERAGYAATAGHATTATTAATALRADHATNADNAIRAQKADVADYALDSDKWDGRQFVDYLNQPVRTTDTVTFSGALVNSQLRIPQVSNAATNALWKSGSYAMLGSAKVWAGRADLWNGLAQPDYLTQAVREIDSPRFAGISSESFVSGFAGEGYRISKDANGSVTAEFDRLTVRKDFSVYELIVNQIRATNGSLWISDAIKIESVTKSGNNYICRIETDQGTIAVPFVVNDILRCQRFNGRNMKYYVARVTATNYTDGTFTVVVIDGASVPAASDEVVRMGNTADKTRQGAIYLTASDNGAPFIDVIDGVTSASLAGKVKARLGKLDGIVDAAFGSLSGYGLYAENVYLRGRIQIEASGSNVYTKGQADEKIGAISVGGRNLVLNSNVLQSSSSYQVTTQTLSESLIIGQEYTVTIWGTAPNGVWFGMWDGNGSADQTGIFFKDDEGVYKATFKPSRWTGNTRLFSIFQLPEPTGARAVSYSRIKIEKGNKGTDWTPAPEDIVTDLSVFRQQTNTKFSVIDGEIASRVSQESFNVLGQKVSAAETSILQQAGLINLRATKTEVTSAIADITEIKDTRNTNQPPSWYFANYPKRTVKEFKTGSVVGLPFEYVQLITTAPWSDQSGGEIIQQASYANRTYTRSGSNNSWTSWVESESTTGAQSKATAAQNGAKSYTDSQISIVNNAISLKSNQTTVDALGARLQSAEAKITPTEINLTVSAQVNDKIASINVGGRNLVLSSNVQQSSSSYQVATQTLSEPLIIGQEYTVTIWGTAPNAVWFGMWDGNGSADQVGAMKVAEGVYRGIWKPSRWTGNTRLFSIFQLPEPTGARAVSYSRIKIEKGNKSTDWTPAPEDVDSELAKRLTETQAKAGLSIVQDGISFFGQTFSFEGKITAKSIVAGSIEAKQIVTSTGPDRTSLNENGDGLFRVRHTNGMVGIEIGLIGGSPSLVFYDENGAKLWEGGMQGIKYVNTIPATWSRRQMFLVASVSSNTQTLDVTTARGTIQSEAQRGENPKTPMGIERHLYNEGNNASSDANKIYSGYHTSQQLSTSNWIPNGWYIFGNAVMGLEMGAESRYFTVTAFRFWNGQNTGSQIINDIYVPPR